MAGATRTACSPVEPPSTASSHSVGPRSTSLRRVARGSQNQLLPFAADEPAKPNGYWAADVQIRCFGRFELSRHGVAVQRWRRRSAERLLKFLLVNGRRVHRDVLLDMLWPDVPNNSSIPRTARDAPRVAASRRPGRTWE